MVTLTFPVLCLLIFFLIPDRLMASATLTIVWLRKPTWHHVNTAFSFLNTHGGWAGLAVTGYVGAAVTPHSVIEPMFSFTGVTPSLLLAPPLMVLHVQRIAFLPCVLHSVKYICSCIC